MSPLTQHLIEAATHTRQAHQHLHLAALAVLEPYIDKLLDQWLNGER